MDFLTTLQLVETTGAAIAPARSAQVSTDPDGSEPTHEAAPTAQETAGPTSGPSTTNRSHLIPAAHVIVTRDQIPGRKPPVIVSNEG
jgi:hypothetical protein